MKKYVYVIKQYQTSSDYNGEPIAVFDTYKQAFEQCEKLNEAYCYGVNFYNDEYFSYEVVDVCEDYHAYTIETLELNKEIPCLND